MNYRNLYAAMIVVVASATSAAGATVSFIENLSEGYVDIFYIPGAGEEFTNWNLNVRPKTGSVLDPIPLQKSFNVQSGPAPLDTFANTVYSSVGAGNASFVHTEYNPGTAFPPVAANPPPTAGALSPAPDELNWAMFDLAFEDGAISGFTPYHMARFMYSAGGTGVITAKFFDTGNAGVGETFTRVYPLPEPSSAFIAGTSLLGLVFVRRRRS